VFSITSAVIWELLWDTGLTSSYPQKDLLIQGSDVLSARPADMSLSLREKVTGHSNSKKATRSVQISGYSFYLKQPYFFKKICYFKISSY